MTMTRYAPERGKATTGDRELAISLNLLSKVLFSKKKRKNIFTFITGRGSRVIKE